jgi:hypothetical protein
LRGYSQIQRMSSDVSRSLHPGVMSGRVRRR